MLGVMTTKDLVRGIERAHQEIRAQARVPVPGLCSQLKPELELGSLTFPDTDLGLAEEHRANP